VVRLERSRSLDQVISDYVFFTFKWRCPQQSPIRTVSQLVSTPIFLTTTPQLGSQCKGAPGDSGFSGNGYSSHVGFCRGLAESGLFLFQPSLPPLSRLRKRATIILARNGPNQEMCPWICVDQLDRPAVACRGRLTETTIGLGERCTDESEASSYEESLKLLAPILRSQIAYEGFGWPLEPKSSHLPPASPYPPFLAAQDRSGTIHRN